MRHQHNLLDGIILLNIVNFVLEKTKWILGFNVEFVSYKGPFKKIVLKIGTFTKLFVFRKDLSGNFFISKMDFS